MLTSIFLHTNRAPIELFNREIFFTSFREGEPFSSFLLKTVSTPHPFVVFLTLGVRGCCEVRYSPEKRQELHFNSLGTG